MKPVHKLLNTGHGQIVDADLSGYFDSIPHSDLLKSVARRVVDGAMLHLIFARTRSISVGLPRSYGGSAPTSPVSRPAQRSLTLRPARSRSRLATLSIEGSGGFVTSTAAPIATGWSDPVAGWGLHPLKTSAFHGAPNNPSWEWYNKAVRSMCDVDSVTQLVQKVGLVNETVYSHWALRARAIKSPLFSPTR